MMYVLHYHNNPKLQLSGLKYDKKKNKKKKKKRIKLYYGFNFTP